MESTGAPNRVQLSQETADLLISAGKEEWVKERAETIDVKGKGSMQTYWLVLPRRRGSKSNISVSSGETSSDDDLGLSSKNMDGFFSKTMNHMCIGRENLTDKVLRLVDWNVDVLCRMLHEIEARRVATGVKRDSAEEISELEHEYLNKREVVLTEVEEIIKLPEYSVETRRYDPEKVVIEFQVTEELKRFVLGIASMYHLNPFHNFEQ